MKRITNNNFHIVTFVIIDSNKSRVFVIVIKPQPVARLLKKQMNRTTVTYLFLVIDMSIDVTAQIKRKFIHLKTILLNTVDQYLCRIYAAFHSSTTKIIFGLNPQSNLTKHFY